MKDIYELTIKDDFYKLKNELQVLKDALNNCDIRYYHKKEFAYLLIDDINLHKIFYQNKNAFKDINKMECFIYDIRISEFIYQILEVIDGHQLFMSNDIRTRGICRPYTLIIKCKPIIAKNKEPVMLIKYDNITLLKEIFDEMKILKIDTGYGYNTATAAVRFRKDRLDLLTKFKNKPLDIFDITIKVYSSNIISLFKVKSINDITQPILNHNTIYISFDIESKMNLV